MPSNWFLRARARAATRLETSAEHVVSALGSRFAFVTILVLFGACSALVALTMSLSIYDEHWHLGIIQEYARQLSPRLQNTTDTTGLGDVEFTGSFLFHWLMSFPYRLFEVVLGDGFVTLVSMRLLGIVMVIGGLYIWRVALLEVLASKVIANVTIGLLASLPLFGFVAATVNYDNLLFLTTAAWFLFVLRLIKGNGERVLDWVWMLTLGFTSLITKYTFAPVFVAVVIILLLRYGAPLIRSIVAGRSISKWKNIALPGLAFALTLTGVFSRYVFNLFTFGSPTPACDVVASRDYCMTHSVFERNERFEANALPGEGSPTGAISVFFADWLPSMLSTLSWVGIRTDSGAVLDSFGGEVTRPLIYITTIVVFALALLLGRVIPAALRWPFWIALGVHSAALFLMNYGNLYAFGLLFAYSARYFFPYLPGLLFLAVAGLALTLPKISAAPKVVAIGVLGFALLLMTQGGGPITYLNAIDADWIHPDSPFRAFVLLLGRGADRFLMIGP
ncbi:MAG: glycosyltransferase family 39 protein [Pseudoclavibacter sp.]